MALLPRNEFYGGPQKHGPLERLQLRANVKPNGELSLSRLVRPDARSQLEGVRQN